MQWNRGAGKKNDTRRSRSQPQARALPPLRSHFCIATKKRVLQAQHREKEAEPSAWFEVDVTPGDCNCASVVLCHARDFHASPPPDGLVPRAKSAHASSTDW